MLVLLVAVVTLVLVSLGVVSVAAAIGQVADASDLMTPDPGLATRLPH